MKPFLEICAIAVMSGALLAAALSLLGVTRLWWIRRSIRRCSDAVSVRRPVRRSLLSRVRVAVARVCGRRDGRGCAAESAESMTGTTLNELLAESNAVRVMWSARQCVDCSHAECARGRRERRLPCAICHMVLRTGEEYRVVSKVDGEIRTLIHESCRLQLVRRAV
jgi:ribosomal protein S27E